MPTYELMLLLRKVSTLELKEALKRTARAIFETGGVLRSIENLGLRKLPYRMKGNDGVYREANYFLYSFDTSRPKLSDLRDSLGRDLDVVRSRIYLIEDKLDIKLKEDDYECDIYLDRREVPFRPHVQEMVRISKTKEKKPFHYGGGRTHDPFAN